MNAPLKFISLYMFTTYINVIHASYTCSRGGQGHECKKKLSQLTQNDSLLTTKSYKKRKSGMAYICD